MPMDPLSHLAIVLRNGRRKHFMRHAWLAIPLLLASSANAAEVGQCNDLDRIGNMVGQTRSFAEGKIRIAHVDTDGEPVCCSTHLLVFIPDPEIGSQCFAVSQRAAKGSAAALGFSFIDFGRIKGAYDPQRGLLLTMPYALYDNETGGRGRMGTASVRIDLRGKGSVRIEQ
jgi:hypothetical protein